MDMNDLCEKMILVVAPAKPTRKFADGRTVTNRPVITLLHEDGSPCEWELSEFPKGVFTLVKWTGDRPKSVITRKLGEAAAVAEDLI